ncbi:MAG: hypothetical protein V3R51_04920 [Gammaproteobacteria bacterium]
MAQLQRWFYLYIRRRRPFCDARALLVNCGKPMCAITPQITGYEHPWEP